MWELTEIAAGKLSCDNEKLDSDAIPAVLRKLEKEFKIQYADKGATTMILAALDFCVEEKRVTIGWDCWSGVFIMSRDKKDNDIIKKIFEYLSKEPLEVEE